MINTIHYFTQQAHLLQDSIIHQRYSKIVVLADANTNGFCVPLLKQLFPAIGIDITMAIPQGEDFKTLETCAYIWSLWLKHELDKNALIINVGGGCLLDIASFCAATYKRGIDFIHIPTTLLAMVDASFGGKTGIDFNRIKNVIGTFTPAKAIYINPVFLNTLSGRKIKSGFAEMIKHSLVSDETKWQKIIQQKNEFNFTSIQAIQESIEIKKAIVALDIFDHGKRQILNFGHSIGHAIESYSLTTNKPLLHGEAVMLGMVYELKLSELLLQTSEVIRHQLLQLKEKYFNALEMNYRFENIFPYVMQDKKNKENIKMSLLKKAGECYTQVDVPLAKLKSIF